MSTKELSYVESSSETELLAESNSSQPDDEIGIKEWCQIRCKPSFQMRRVKNKGAILILIWSYLISSIYTIGLHYIDKQYRDSHTLVDMLVLIPMGLTVVLAATLADFRFGRYKVISFSLWIVWICSILLTLTAIITDFIHIGCKVSQVLHISRDTNGFNGRPCCDASRFAPRKVQGHLTQSVDSVDLLVTDTNGFNSRPCCDTS